MKVLTALLGLFLFLSGCATRDRAMAPELPPRPTEMQEVKRLYESGELDRAEDLALWVQENHPEHKAARYYLGLIREGKASRAARRAQSTFWYPTLPMQPVK